MSTLVIPVILANGNQPQNIVDGVGLNSNFNAIAAAVNNIYPSQVLPLTALQATFGATATGVGYKFLANDATATPLAISGVSGQSVDIFDVTLTSGGTKALFVSSAGAVNVGAGNATPYGDLGIARTGGVTGAIGLGGQQFDYGLVVAGSFGMQKPLYSSIAAAAHTLNYRFLNNASRTTAMGFSNSISINTVAGTVWLLTDESNIDAASINTTGDLGIAGTLHQTSLRSKKHRIEYVDPNEALEVALATKIARYDWVQEDEHESGKLRHASFIADEAPWQLSGGPGYEHADPQKTASYALAAVAALHARVIALESK